jgi:hypothetical protein
MSDFMEQREDKQVSFGQRVKGEPAVKADNAYFAVNNCLSVYRRAFNVDLKFNFGESRSKIQEHFLKQALPFLKAGSGAKLMQRVAFKKHSAS